jgi:hypothetical protein
MVLDPVPDKVQFRICFPALQNGAVRNTDLTKEAIAKRGDKVAE